MDSMKYNFLFLKCQLVSLELFILKYHLYIYGYNNYEMELSINIQKIMDIWYYMQKNVNVYIVGVRNVIINSIMNVNTDVKAYANISIDYLCKWKYQYLISV